MIEIAKILKPVGLKGEMKLQLFLKDYNSWQKIKNVTTNSQSYKVDKIRFYKGYGFVFLCGIDSIDKASKLRNKTIYAKKEDIDTQVDEYLIQDLLGCEIVDESGNFVGVVEDIESYGTADIINFICLGAKRSFPFLRQIIKRVDVASKQVVVDKNKLDEVVV